MNVFDEIEQRMRKYPHVRHERDGNFLKVHAVTPEGFDVGIEQHDDAFIVFFDGWHEPFSDAETALNCLAFGLSEECRLRVESRGAFAYRWTVECWSEGDWAEDSATGLYIFAYWRRRSVRYLQNKLIKRT